VPFRAKDLKLAPNVLSASRIPLAVSFPFVATHPLAAIVVLCAAAATDVLDGWLARRLGQTTPTGALIDGVADKIFGVTVVVTLVAYGLLASPFAVLLATRELVELPLALRVISSRRPGLATIDRRANVLGKLASSLQLASAIAVVAGAAFAVGLVVAAAAAGAVAAVSYWVREIRAHHAALASHQSAYAP
jgi:CDP-diacylglycerol--glycerol-3-phosphate 3-phosphatidyltransferase/cardiolipin synthase